MDHRNHVGYAINTAQGAAYPGQDQDMPGAIPSGDLPHLIEQATSIAKNTEAVETDLMHLIARLYGEGHPPEPEKAPTPIPVGAFHELKARMNAIEYHLDRLHQRVERLRNLA